MRGKRFLLLRADIARPVLREGLEKLGGVVEDVAIYQTGRPAAVAGGGGGGDRRRWAVGWVTFTSASHGERICGSC